MSSRNIRLLVAYDGSGLGGWQRQSNARSVQGELEAALARMHDGAVPVIGAGRTDAGVHAAGQVANFYTGIASIPAGRFAPALNRLLPPDVRVLSSEEADPDFHARYDARLRRYKYFIASGNGVAPWTARYAHWERRVLDLSRLDAMAGTILGEKDFTAFSSAKDPSENRSRFVHSSRFYREGELTVYEVSANAFLWRMVRSLAGTMLWLEGLGQGAREMAGILASRDRSLAGPTAPAKGLFLWDVEYYREPTRKGRAAYFSAKGIGSAPRAGLAEKPAIVPGYGPVEPGEDVVENGGRAP